MGAKDFAEGIEHANRDLASIRRERAERLSNYVNGFELNKATGEYVANERGQLAMEAQRLKLEQNVSYLSLQNQMIADQLASSGMTSFTEHLASGNPNDAQKVVDNNPILKERLAKSFNFQRVTTLDPEHDKDLLAKNGVYVDPQAILSDPKKRQAFNSMFAKGIKSDGSVDLIHTPSLVKETNYKQYVPEYRYQDMATVFNNVSDILKGHVKTQAEIEAEALHRQAQNQANRASYAKSLYSESITGQRLKDMNTYFADNPNATLDDYARHRAEQDAKAQSGGGTAQTTDPLKAQKIETEKARRAKIEEDIKLKKEKFELDKKRQLEEAKIAKEKALAKAKKEANTPDEFEKAKVKIERVDGIYKKLIDGKPLTTEDKAHIIADAKKIPASLKIPAETKKKINERINVVESSAQAVKLLNSGKIDANAVSNTISAVKKYISSEKIGKDKYKISLSEMNEADKNLLMRSKIGRSLVLYIKSISGAAVTNEEYDRLNSLMTGGNNADIHTLSMLFNSFYKDNRDRLLSDIKNSAYKDPSIMLNISGKEFIKVRPKVFGAQEKSTTSTTSITTGSKARKTTGSKTEKPVNLDDYL